MKEQKVTQVSKHQPQMVSSDEDRLTVVVKNMQSRCDLSFPSNDVQGMGDQKQKKQQEKQKDALHSPPVDRKAIPFSYRQKNGYHVAVVHIP